MQTTSINEDTPSINDDKAIAHKNLKSVFMIFLLLFLVGVIGYLFYQNYSLNKQIVELERKVANTNEVLEPVINTKTTEKESNFSELKLIETREDFESRECLLSAYVIDDSGNKLSIEGSSDKAIARLSCGDSLTELYDDPYDIKVSEWSTVSDSFIIYNGQDEYGTNILTKYIVENGLVNVFSDFNINSRIVGYIPSLNYILTEDFKVFDTNGDLVTEFEVLPNTGEERNTFLIENEETFLITSRIDNEETYTEYFYLFNPSTAEFYLAGSDTYQSAGIGCPKEYMKLDRDAKILSGVGCLNETVQVEVKF